jgi:tetratricopeptide (TPR) repeat protein
VTVIGQGLEALTDDKFFETLCNTVLTGAGLRPNPRGGSSDSGRDAVVNSGTGELQSIFQYSIEKDVRRKLKYELGRYEGGAKKPKEYLYVTSRAVSAKTKDEFVVLFGNIGIKLEVFDQDWLVPQLMQDRNSGIRNELLAKYFQAVPDVLRFMLKSPLASSALAALEPQMTGALLDEKLRVAGALLDGRKYAEAKEAFDRAESLGGLDEPQKRVLHNNRANACVQLGLVEEAKTDWSEAIRLSKEEQTPAANLANTILLLENDLKGSEEIASEALKSDPKNSKLLNVLGMIEMERRNSDAAAVRFKEALDVEQRPEFLMNLWQSREDAGEQVPLKDLEDALTRWPNEPALVLRMANRLIEEFQVTANTEQIAKAQEMLASLIGRLWPELLTSPEAAAPSVPPLDRDLAGLSLNSYAGTLYWNKQITRATELIRGAMILSQNVGIKFSLGQILSGAGNYRDAIPAYQAAIDAGKTDTITFCQLGNAYMGLLRQTNEKGLIEKAAVAFERAAEQDVEILANAAALRWQAGDRERALEMLEKVVRERPDCAVARVNQIIFLNQDRRVALQALLELEETFPTEFNVLTAIADHFFMIDDWGNALVYCRRVITQPPPFAFLMEQVYVRGALCEQRTRKGEAGKMAALEFALDGIRRFPDSKMLKDFLGSLSA